MITLLYFRSNWISAQRYLVSLQNLAATHQLQNAFLLQNNDTIYSLRRIIGKTANRKNDQCHSADEGSHAWIIAPALPHEC